MSNVKQILKKIAGIAKAEKNSVAVIQAVALETMEHRAEHGDNTLMTELVNALSRGRKELMIEYMRAFGAVTWAKEENKFKNTKDIVDIDGAKAVLWNEYAKIITVSELTFDKVISRINKLIADAEKLSAEDQNKVFELINLDRVRLIKAA